MTSDITQPTNYMPQFANIPSHSDLSNPITDQSTEQDNNASVLLAGDKSLPISQTQDEPQFFCGVDLTHLAPAQRDLLLRMYQSTQEGGGMQTNDAGGNDAGVDLCGGTVAGEVAVSSKVEGDGSMGGGGGKSIVDFLNGLVPRVGLCFFSHLVCF